MYNILQKNGGENGLFTAPLLYRRNNDDKSSVKVFMRTKKWGRGRGPRKVKLASQIQAVVRKCINSYANYGSWYEFQWISQSNTSRHDDELGNSLEVWNCFNCFSVFCIGTNVM